MRWKGRRRSQNVDDRRGFESGRFEDCDTFAEEIAL